MSKEVLKYLLSFVVLTLLQLLVFNNVVLFSTIHPYIYLVFIFLLPIHYSRWLVLILAFLIGFIIDIFSNTYGLHSAAMAFIGFLRPVFLNILVTERDENIHIEPHFNTLNPRRYAIYVLALVFSHHLVLFFLESITFAHFWLTLSKVLLNFISSAVIIFLYDLLIYKRR